MRFRAVINAHQLNGVIRVLIRGISINGEAIKRASKPVGNVATIVALKHDALSAAEAVWGAAGARRGHAKALPVDNARSYASERGSRMSRAHGKQPQ